MLDKKVFKKGIGALIQVFPNRKIESAVYWTFLHDLTTNEFKKGITRIITEAKEIYPDTNLIALIRDKAKVPERKSAFEAWQIVQQQIIRVGSYGYPVINDALIMRAIGIVDWYRICKSERPEIERAHFLKVYEQLVKREQESFVQLPVKNLETQLNLLEG